MDAGMCAPGSGQDNREDPQLGSAPGDDQISNLIPCANGNVSP